MRQTVSRLPCAHTLLPQPGSLPFTLFAFIGVLLIFADDLLLRHARLPVFLDALTDEPAHAITALLGVGAVYTLRQQSWHPAICIGALLGGTVIDLDHIPELFHSDIISVGTERPYSHSLLTLGILLLVIVRLRGSRRLVGGAVAWGLAWHFARDLVDNGTVPLIWPITRHGFAMPYPVYAVLLLACLVAIACGHHRPHKLS